MIPLEQKSAVVTVEQLGSSKKIVLEKWLDLLAQQKASTIREPIINRAKLTELLVQATETGRSIVFVAIGCQDWIKPSWGDPTTDRIMGRIKDDNKRAQRFVTELTSFSQALTSFHVPHKIHFSLSDIEPLMHIHQQNMGLTIHNSDAEAVLHENTVFLNDRFQENSVPVTPFSHSQKLFEMLGTNDLTKVQEIILGNNPISYRMFLDNLYALDLLHTAQCFMSEEDLGPVWLDIQSLNFSEDVVALVEAAAVVTPSMPILTIFPNAGNWHAKQVPAHVAASKEDTIAKMVGAAKTPTTPKAWVDAVHKVKDQDLLRLLKEFGVIIESISSGEEKTAAVRIFFQLAFGFDPFNTQEEV